MAAARHGGGALALPSSPTSLLLARSIPAPDLAARRPRRPRQWVVAAAVPAVAGALAASAPAGATLLRDGGATLLVTAGAYSLVRAFDMLTERRLVEQLVAPTGGGSQSTYSGCIYDMVDKAAEASLCDVPAEGVVLWDEALVKTTSPEDPQMRCKELRCYNDTPVIITTYKATKKATTYKGSCAFRYLRRTWCAIWGSKAAAHNSDLRLQMKAPRRTMLLPWKAG